MRQAGDGTAGVAEDAVALLQLRGRRPPPASEPSVEKLSRSGDVIPDGDRRDAAESRCVEDERQPVTPADDDVVRVLVLRHDLVNQARRRLDAEPIEHGAESPHLSQCDAELREVPVRDVTGGVDADWQRGHTPNEESARRAARAGRRQRVRRERGFA